MATSSQDGKERTKHVQTPDPTISISGHAPQIRSSERSKDPVISVLGMGSGIGKPAPERFSKPIQERDCGGKKHHRTPPQSPDMAPRSDAPAKARSPTLSPPVVVGSAVGEPAIDPVRDRSSSGSLSPRSSPSIVPNSPPPLQLSSSPQIKPSQAHERELPPPLGDALGEASVGAGGTWHNGKEALPPLPVSDNVWTQPFLLPRCLLSPHGLLYPTRPVWSPLQTLAYR